MKIEVYGDIVFLINFCMDYILLAFMCKILSCNSTRLRLTLAAALGGVGAVCAFYVPMQLGVPMQLCLGVLMCIIAAPCTSPRALFIRALVLWAEAFVFGGGCLLVLCAAGADVLVRSGAFYIDMNLGVLIAASVLCGVLLWVLDLVVKHTGVRHKRTVRVEFMGKTVALRGFIDTGNTLTSHGTPVMLVSWDSIRTLFPEEADSYSFMLYCPPGRVQPVTYKVMDGGGIVWCIEPDGVSVGGKRCNALVGVCVQRLAEEYDALLHVTMA